jgi:hypothetical protein
LRSTSDAQNAAQQIWNLYLGGSSSSRPFGSAKLDGVDLDIEGGPGTQYYQDFVDALMALYATDTSKKYYLTAVPQCECIIFFTVSAAAALGIALRAYHLIGQVCWILYHAAAPMA